MSRSGKAAASRRHKGKKPAPSRQASHRSYQQAPSPVRYREIQQALAGKGYLAGETNGSWGSESVEALKRFQREQNLNPTGKLDSVSLIALGLGPKRNLTAHTAPQSDQTRPEDDHRRPQGSERP